MPVKYERHALRHDQSPHAALTGAQGHPQADFAGSLVDGVDEDPIQADGGEPEGDQAEDAQEGDADAGLEEAAVDDLLSGPDAADQHLRIDRRRSRG